SMSLSTFDGAQDDDGVGRVQPLTIMLSLPKHELVALRRGSGRRRGGTRPPSRRHGEPVEP
ncbi:MAG: hypothetical protein VW709_10730, partial [Rickettsiales bacterium]